MTISVQCDECFQSYQVRDERAGQRLKCKSCGAKIRVPAANEEVEDLYEDYGEPVEQPRKKKKSAPAKKKKKKSKKAINVQPKNIVKKIFGCLAIAVGLLILAGGIYMLFAGEGPDGKKGRPFYAMLVASVFFGVGKKWIMDE